MPPLVSLRIETGLIRMWYPGSCGSGSGSGTLFSVIQSSFFTALPYLIFLYEQTQDPNIELLIMNLNSI